MKFKDAEIGDLLRYTNFHGEKAYRIVIDKTPETITIFYLNRLVLSKKYDVYDEKEFQQIDYEKI